MCKREVGATCLYPRLDSEVAVAEKAAVVTVSLWCDQLLTVVPRPAAAVKAYFWFVLPLLVVPTPVAAMTEAPVAASVAILAPC